MSLLLVRPTGTAARSSYARVACAAFVPPRVAGALAAALLLSVGLALVLRALPHPPPASPPTPTAESPWREVDRPAPLYTLETRAFGLEPNRYRVRQHMAGGGRQDLLRYGADALGSGPLLQIILYRPGRERTAALPFYVELARQAALATFAVDKSALPDLTETRFGAFETAGLSLSSGVATAPCLGFRGTDPTAALHIAGFACGGARPIDKATLSCVLERLDIVGREDEAMAGVFARAEQQRGVFCPPSSRSAGDLPTKPARPKR